MTCQHARAQLEDYIDGELAPDQVDQLKRHLETCPDCRAEYEDGLHIKSILGNQAFPEPGPQYWAEVMPLIMARTVQSGEQDLERIAVGQGAEDQKLRFVRSAVLLAASIALMYTAISLGGSYKAQKETQAGSPRPFFVASSVRGLTGSDNFAIVTPKEQAEMAQVTAVMGAPGILGRFTVLPGLLSFE